VTEEEAARRSFREWRELLTEARTPDRSMRILKTESGFVRLAFFDRWLFVTQHDAAGWPARSFVRPVRRGSRKLAPLLVRAGLGSEESRMVEQELAANWPSRTPHLGRVLVGVGAMYALAVVGGLALARRIVVGR
jgi:hypothetical protein